ncbi:MAG: hypothetical protein JWN48_5323 [Myxococcaceae bacterium]|nr:hypothetical protein [Myxococcaceae bacterium]
MPGFGKFRSHPNETRAPDSWSAATRRARLFAKKESGRIFAEQLRACRGLEQTFLLSDRIVPFPYRSRKPPIVRSFPELSAGMSGHTAGRRRDSYERGGSPVTPFRKVMSSGNDSSTAAGERSMPTTDPFNATPSHKGKPTRSEEGALHDLLYRMSAERLRPGVPDPEWVAKMLTQAHGACISEHDFLERERARVSVRAAEAPREAQAFGDWFEALRENGPGQYDPLFEFLAQRASRQQVCWFVRQEVAGEAGFDDLVALTQLRMPERAKLEMARNYWDEMGRGKRPGMHGPMLHVLAEELGVLDTPPEELVWEALALANLLVGLAYNRRYAYHAVGALGAIELTAPTRARPVADALERVGVTKEATSYFRLHATIDVTHFADWKKEVLVPLVQEQPMVAPLIAEGALMRLAAGARTFARYRRELGVSWNGDQAASSNGHAA